MSHLIVWTNDQTKLCFAGILKRYMQKLSPGQIRLFCNPASKVQMATFSSLGWFDVKMSPS